MDEHTYTGRLDRWKDDKGFGFIKTRNVNTDTFVHTSAFKTMGRRPVVGDIINYQVHTDNSGKTRAVNATIQGVSPTKPTPQIKRRAPKPKSKLPIAAVALLSTAIAGLLFYQTLDKPRRPIHVIETKSSSATSPSTTNSRYTCSGKIHCSEMTSCAEATFYLRNCPGTKMDGDHDGKPCESQLCGH